MSSQGHLAGPPQVGRDSSWPGTHVWPLSNLHTQLTGEERGTGLHVANSG